MSPVLETRRISLRHPRADADAVRDVSVEISRGEVVALVGPNGSGKSTLLSALAGILRPRSGKVFAAGRDLATMKPRERARGSAFLPQRPECPEGLTVAQLVQIGRYSRSGWMGGARPGDATAVSHALDATNLSELRGRRVEHLSGGERQRAWIAMALAQEAAVTLLDEPTASLDLRSQEDLVCHLAELNERVRTTLVVVLHDLSHAQRIADRIVMMRGGRIYDSGPAASVLSEESLRDVFGVSMQRGAQSESHVRVHGVANPVRSL